MNNDYWKPNPNIKVVYDNFCYYINFIFSSRNKEQSYIALSRIRIIDLISEK